MSPGNIVSLDSAVRLTRANTLRSGEYLGKASRLIAVQQKRLETLEGKLFQKRRALETCKDHDKLRKPEDKFVCAEGQIWYYFSYPQRKFFLLDFKFGPGGTGGLPIPSNDDDSQDKPLCRARGFSKGRLVARESIAIRMSLTWAASAGNDITNYSAESDNDLASRGEFVSSLGSDRVYIIREPFVLTSDKLPYWSILKGCVASSEQLGNPFARSIIAGEAISRAALRSRFGRESRKFRNSNRPAGTLLQESVAVLGLMFSGDLPVDNEFKKLQITGALAWHLLADDSFFWIVRSEMIAHLALHVANSTNRFLARHSKGKTTSDKQQVSKSMKSFSLLGEFFVLTGLILGGYVSSVHYERTWKEAYGMLADRRSRVALKRVGAFKCKLHELLPFTRIEQPFDKGVGGDEMLQRRVLRVTEEILSL